MTHVVLFQTSDGAGIFTSRTHRTGVHRGAGVDQTFQRPTADGAGSLFPGHVD